MYIIRNSILTFKRKMRTGYANFVCIVFNYYTCFGYNTFLRMHWPNPDMPFHATGHQITRIRTERNASNIFVVSGQLPTMITADNQNKLNI